VHEKRNFILVLLLLAAAVWAIISWLILGPPASGVWPQRIGSLAIIATCGAWLLYALKFEDKLPDHLRSALGEQYYYEADGICFMPIVRSSSGRTELSVYYQNRFEGPVQCIVHLRPPVESFLIRPGVRDVHIAFRCDGGDFGVIHQPIAVPRELQGEVLEVKLAAASFYPRSHGSRLRRRNGMPCGSLNVDWGASAFRTGVHEVSGEIELIQPAILHLSMPVGVRDDLLGDTWKQERLVAGMA
jgi:hypothetical protein